MKCSNASSLLAQVNSTIVDIDSLVSQGADSRSQGYFAKYLTVYLSGAYEQCIEDIVSEAAKNTGNNEIAGLVSSKMDQTFRNPDTGKIKELITQCNPQWKKQFNRIKPRYTSALDSIVSNKNLIAHGSPCAISLRDIKLYHIDAEKVIHFIDQLFLGS